LKSAEEILKKSISGTKWMVILSLLAMPLGYIVNILLGRLSTEALGAYSLYAVTVGFISSFIILGGNNAIVRYLPQLPVDKKIPFLWGYFLIQFVIASLALLVLVYYPRALDLALGQTLSQNIKIFLFFLIPAVILLANSTYILNALMEIKTSAFITQLISWGNLVGYLFLFIFARSFFSANVINVVWGLSLSIYVLMLIVSLTIVLKKIKSFNVNNDFRLPKPHIPPGFWWFSLTLYGCAIIYFLSEKIDQLFIIQKFDLNQLGLYYASLQTANIIRSIPILIGSTLLPTFSNLIASNDLNMIQEVFRRNLKYFTLFIFVASLFCMLFSKEILSLFGAEYALNYQVLSWLSIFSGVSSLGTISPALIIARGHSTVYFVNALIQLVIQTIMIFVLTGRLGITGLAISKGIGLGIAQIGLALIVIKILHMNIKILREYFVSILILVSLAILYFTLSIDEPIIRAVMFLCGTAIFVYLGKYTIKDIKQNLLLVFSVTKK
jgi:O-antigen/teichoic acid export membrane protein